MKRFLIFLCLLVLGMTGCSAAVPDDTQAQEQAAQVVENLSRAAEEISDGMVLTETEYAAEAEESGETETGDPDGASAMRADLAEHAYDYQQLSKEEQKLYEIILDGLLRSASDVPIPETEEDVFEKVFQCVINDHPEIFYVDGYTFIKYTKGEIVTGNAFSGSYIYDPQEIAQRKEQIEEKVSEILDGVPAAGSEYDKVKYVYEYLITHTEYVQGAEDNQNICSVFLGGKSVCQGYAKAAQYLFDRIGIYSVFVSGRVESGEDHAWNIVRVDGDYYHIDTTWGDASYVADGPGSGYDGKLPEINYEYLCVPDRQLFRTHTIGSVVPVPECNSMTANYYVREGAYFTEADMDKAAGLFAKAYEDGTAYVTFKCADSAVYEEMERHLIDQQEVFRYLHTTDGTVAYTTNEAQLALSFWL
ncbi:transglutaminase domain-containing protein [Lachnospiraceae bacterium JLR.KK008]